MSSRRKVHPPGLPRRPASEIHLRPKPDHRLSAWTGVWSTLRSFRPGRDETGGDKCRCRAVSQETHDQLIFHCATTEQLCAHISKYQTGVETNERKITGAGSSCVEPIPELLCGFPKGPLVPNRPQINHPI